MESLAVKQEGDYSFYKGDLEAAREKYVKSVEIDQENEYALANIGVINMKRCEYKECIVRSSAALKQIESFHEDTKTFQTSNVLEVKILLRRGKCYEMEGELQKARDDLDKCMILEPKNGEARTMLKAITVKIDAKIFGKHREDATNFLKEKKFFEALESYEKCLRTTKKATTMDNIAIYVNKIACLLALDKIDRVVTESNEAIRLIRNFRIRAANEKLTKDDIERLRQMDLRVAIRKANALGKLSRTTDAINEYERALKIDPGNAQVTKELDAIRRL